MNIPHPPVPLEEKERAVAHWLMLAEEAERGAELGLIHPSVASAQANCYRRAASSIKHEIDTGEAVCSCCFKTFGRGSFALN